MRLIKHIVELREWTRPILQRNQNYIPRGRSSKAAFSLFHLFLAPVAFRVEPCVGHNVLFCTTSGHEIAREETERRVYYSHGQIIVQFLHSKLSEFTVGRIWHRNGALQIRLFQQGQHENSHCNQNGDRSRLSTPRRRRAIQHRARARNRNQGIRYPTRRLFHHDQSYQQHQRYPRRH
jgi:hypothetical protein